ncbi:carotenoid oxygenase family protein [Salinibacter ruber]|uniref:carotenoid oxygenase family protein n=1 Tax=Salinibacter ruber TaxID=146919 RepID=UPI00216A0E4E|nr:carotenoid oxygenase family protein [Salinibacter ruber]MCS4198440.1 carotenoid cleavage dioxygenase-like enzyme [Salinibacter ruber]
MSEHTGYHLGFESLNREIEASNLPVSGDLPGWLSGTLIRNGPGQFEIAGQSYNHWFDGLAMLHAFKIGEGKVSYRNRFLQSKSRTEALKEGQIARPEFATDPCMSIFERVMSLFRSEPPKPTDNASINVARLDGAYVALTATPLPVAFDPETLETAGVVDYEDDIGADMSTAHPHIDPASGDTLTQMLSFGKQSHYILGRIEPDSRSREPVAKLEVGKPSYMHSFGMTERYVILSEWPYVINPLDLLVKGKPFIENFEWDSGRDVRFRVLRKSDGQEVRTLRAEPGFAFHHVNAFERDGEVICDVVGYEDASIIEDYFLDNLRNDSPVSGTGHLHRYQIPLGESEVTGDGFHSGETTAGRAIRHRLSDERIELPRIHEGEARAQSYKYVYGIGEKEVGSFADQLVKIDVETGSSQTWDENETYPGEPVFVPDPDGSDEDDGVVLSVVLDPEAKRSFLLVLDAKSFTERARAEVPHPIPFGFHGQFFS